MKSAKRWWKVCHLSQSFIIKSILEIIIIIITGNQHYFGNQWEIFIRLEHTSVFNRLFFFFLFFADWKNFLSFTKRQHFHIHENLIASILFIHCVVPENIPTPLTPRCSFGLKPHHHPTGNSSLASYTTLNIHDFEIPVNFQWPSLCGYFQELHILAASSSIIMCNCFNAVEPLVDNHFSVATFLVIVEVLFQERFVSHRQQLKVEIFPFWNILTPSCL